MVCDESLLDFTRVLSSPINVSLPDGSYTSVVKIGDMHLTPHLVLKDVLLVPVFKHNLLSISQLASASNIEVTFSSTECLFQDHVSKKVLAVGNKIGRLYYIHGKLSQGLVSDCNVSSVTDHKSVVEQTHLKTMHARLGHASLSKMRHISECPSNNVSNFFCEVCLGAKFHRLPFDRSSSRALASFELVHIDLWGPYRHKSMNGASYFLTILDDFSRCTWTYLLHNKSQVFKTISGFLLYVENQFNKSVKIIRTDHGTENIQSSCTNLFAAKGIVHQLSIVGVPQQNGRVERKHKHLLEVARALRIQANLPIKFWGDCILTATHLINMLPTVILDWKSPFEMLFGDVPDYASLRVFGSLCFAYNLDRSKDKFNIRAKKCIFLGYPFGQKGYKVYDIGEHKCFISRDVVFQEDVFPFKTDNATHVAALPNTISLPIITSNSPTNNPDTSSLPSLSTNHITSSSPPTNSSFMPSPSFSNSQIQPVSTSQISQSSQSSPHNSLVPTPNPDYPKPTRLRKPPAKLQEFVCPTLHPNSSQSASFSVMQHSTAIVPEPKNYTEASKHPEWIAAMNRELYALEENDTWELTTLPPGKKAIGSKWVFKTKYKADGSIERYKARFVAIGYQQVPGEHFNNTFSPVAKLSTVRVIVSLATTNQWPIKQLDINNAFLHGYLEEEVYMKPPQGYTKAKPGEVCRLKRSLYGLRQASRQWNKQLTKYLIGLGFVQSYQDYSLFTRTLEHEFIAVLVYVDDILITGSSSDQINSIKEGLHNEFTIKDLGDVSYFLGIEVIRSPNGTILSQKKYIKDIIEDVGMANCKPASAPLPKGLGLSTDSGELLEDPEVYRRLIGRLQYLNITRPDLSYATQHLSQFMHSPRQPHMNAALYVVRYLKGTMDKGLYYGVKSDHTITAFSDADFSTCSFSSRSLSAYCIFLGSHLVSWKTKKQGTVSKSSAEAEYRSMSSTASEVVWLEELLQDLKIQIPLPVTMYCDNTSAEYLAHNPGFHEKTKHIKRDWHYVREQVDSGFICTQHISSSHQLADILTKALPSPQHNALVAKLGLVDITQVQLEGGI
ncbi:Retrovirus-related Pol polyprotein from transposon TNT 1-94 [Bienertia sinuspersici]